MTHYRKLTGESCYLSPCAMPDANKWVQWDNNLEIAIPLGHEVHQCISYEKRSEMLRKSLETQRQTFSIVAIDNDKFIGHCGLFDIDSINRRARLYIVIGEQAYQNNGNGREAVALLVDYGFNLLNLNSIMIDVFAFNARAMKCYQKVGFRPIGVLRQSRIIGGEKLDVIMMDILAEEFDSPYVKPTMAKLTTPPS